MDARARAALENMRAAYKSLEALHIKVRWTAQYTGDMSADDFPLPGPETLELRMQRPNKFFMAASANRDGKPSSYLIVSDGTSLWYWRSGANTYTQTRAPATLTEMARLLPDNAIGTVDGTSWTADTIIEWDQLVSEIAPLQGVPGVAITIASERIGDAPVDVIRTKSTDEVVKLMGVASEVNLYLSAVNHLVQGYKLDVNGKNEDTGKNFSVNMQAIYDVFDAQPRFGATDFVFTPPPGAKEVAAPRPTVGVGQGAVAAPSAVVAPSAVAAPSVSSPPATGRLDNAQTVADLIAYHQDAVAWSALRARGVISRWELPVRVYIDPSVKASNVERALAAWQTATGLAYAISATDTAPRILVRAGREGLVGTAEGRGGIDATTANNQARSGLVQIRPDLAACDFAERLCATLYTRLLGAALGLLGQVAGGITSGAPQISQREINILVALYRLPHGTQLKPDGTWAVVR